MHYYDFSVQCKMSLFKLNAENRSRCAMPMRVIQAKLFIQIGCYSSYLLIFCLDVIIYYDSKLYVNIFIIYSL